MLRGLENNYYIKPVQSNPIHELFTYKTQKLLLTSKPTLANWQRFLVRAYWECIMSQNWEESSKTVEQISMVFNAAVGPAHDRQTWMRQEWRNKFLGNRRITTRGRRFDSTGKVEMTILQEFQMWKSNFYRHGILTPVPRGDKRTKVLGRLCLKIMIFPWNTWLSFKVIKTSHLIFTT